MHLLTLALALFATGGPPPLPLGPRLMRPPALQAPLDPAPRPLPRGAARARYEMTLLGSLIAEPVITLGAVDATGAGREVRSLTIDVSTLGVAREVYRFDNRYAAILDADTLRPLRSRLEARRRRAAWTLSRSFEGALVTTQREAGGRMVAWQTSLEPGAFDMVAWVPWLQAQQLEPGASVSATLLHHRQPLRLMARAVTREVVSVPFGVSRGALRVECELVPWHPLPALPSGERARRRRAVSKLTLWLADDPWQTPIRILTTFSGLGTVDIELVDRQLLR